jgi:small multidrug resistance pump
MTHPYVLLGVAIVAEVIATSALKSSDGFTRALPGLVSAIGYVVAFYLLALAMRTIPTGVVYAVWSGLGIVLIAALSWVRLGEALDLAAVLGLALIVAGVLVVNLFSDSIGH